MADTDDALKHFIASSDDPYTLLDLPSGPASTEKEIRSAWKKTALKYHPDKLRASSNSATFDEAEANRLYILRQDAYGILSEPHLREQYDNALRAKEAKKQRDAAVTGKRGEMKEELERRERDAAVSGKRKREEEDVGERELERLRMDGQRRRRERAEMLRRQAEEKERLMQQERDEGLNAQQETRQNGSAQAEVQDIDRVIKLRFVQNDHTAHLTQERVTEMFSRFGPVEAVTLREKKVKVDGEKHRKMFMTVAVIFESIVGAHAAVSDFPQIVKREDGDWSLLEPPEWASGRQPECIPSTKTEHHEKPQSPAFTPTSNGSANGSNGDMDDILMIRLKNAEKKRREDKRKREDEAAAAAAANGEGMGDEASSASRRPMPNFGSFKTKSTTAKGEEDAEKRREAEKRRLEEAMRREEEQEENRAAAGGIAV